LIDELRKQISDNKEHLKKSWVRYLMTKLTRRKEMPKKQPVTIPGTLSEDQRNIFLWMKPWSGTLLVKSEEPDLRQRRVGIPGAKPVLQPRIQKAFSRK
jgi:hypothetical protein